MELIGLASKDTQLQTAKVTTNFTVTKLLLLQNFHY